MNENLKKVFEEYSDMWVQSFPLWLKMVDGKKVSSKMPYWQSEAVVSYNSVRLLLDTNECNSLAIITGIKSNLLVLDIDNAGVANVFLHSKGIVVPEGTPFVLTQGGGIHYYFSFPDDLKETSTTKSFKKNGFDIRGEGGIIYAPPSQVEGGGEYVWQVELTREALNPPPEALIKFILDSNAKVNNEVRVVRGEADIAFLEASDACQHIVGKIDNREDWLQAGRALTEMGEKGRALFQMITCGNPFYPDDGVDVANKKYDDLLRNTNATRIESLYYIARNLGWTPSNDNNITDDMPPIMEIGGKDSEVDISAKAIVYPEDITLTTDQIARYAYNGTLGLAELGRKLFRDKYVYDIPRGTWRAYKNGVWAIREKQAIIVKIASKIASTLNKALEVKRSYLTGDAKADKPLKSVIATLSSARKSILSGSDVTVCKKMEGLLYAGRERPFDADTRLINVLNGVVDLKTFKLLPHNAEYLMSKQAPVNYDPSATCPFWDSFMNTSIVNPFLYGGVEITDHETIGMIKRYCGTTLVGEVLEQGLLYLQGGGGNGKSTFTNTLSRVLGDYASPVSMETIVTVTKDNNKFNMAHLPGVRGYIFDEIERGKYLAESTVKTLTSGEDKVTAAFKGKDVFSFMPQGSIFLQGNNELNIRSQDMGIWRRIHKVMWNHSYTSKDNISKLIKGDEIKRKVMQELPGIFTWMVQGLSDYYQVGLNASPNSTRDTQEYRDENDVIGTFLEDVTQVSDTGRVGKKILYTAYRYWCEEEGRKPLANSNFTREAKKTTFYIENGISEGKYNGNRYFSGIVLQVGKTPADMSDLAQLVRPILGTEDMSSFI